MYSKWLPVTVLFSEQSRITDALVIFISAAGIAVIFLLAFTVCLRKSVFNTILATAPIIFLTFVITDLNADTIYLLGIVAVYLTMLICSAVSPDNYIKRGMAVLPAFAVTALIMLIAYMFAPYGTYAREEQIAELGNRFRYVASQMGRFGQYWQTRPGGGWGSDIAWLRMTDGGIWQFNTSNVFITNSGDRIITDQGLLEITVDEPGTFYIRGFSMHDFNGQTWSGNDDFNPQPNDGFARAMPAFTASLSQLIDLDNPPVPVQMFITRTGDQTPRVYYRPYYGGEAFSDDMRILPGIPAGRFYYIDSGVHRILEALDSEELDLTDRMEYANYSWDFLVAVLGTEDFTLTLERNVEWEIKVNIDSEDYYDGYASLLQLGTNSGFSEYVAWIQNSNIYTQVDPNTAQGLRQLAIEAGINPNAGRAEVVDAVAAFVRSSGTYTLEPGTIPRGEDFALYFLQTLQEGYCIHFATAAVLMLRSLDIPARFTSGYVATVPRSSVDTSLVLTDRNAHAWVEVFYEDVGWLYLEVTPAGSGSFIPAPSQHTPVTDTPAPQTPLPQTPSPEEFTPPPDFDNIENNAPGPDTGNTSGQDNNMIPEETITTIIFAFCIILLISALPIRRSIIIKHRRVKLSQDNTNKAAIYAWHYISQLHYRVSAAPEYIEELALKARFSQHRLTEEERDLIVEYASSFASKLYNSSSRSKRFLLKYIKSIY